MPIPAWYVFCMEPRLIQSQSQKLILSPQMRQYLRLLQLPLAELEQAVETEMTENPVLQDKKEDEIADVPESERDSTDMASAPEPVSDSKEIRVGEVYDHLEDLEDTYQPSFGKDFSKQDTSEMEERRNYQESLLTKPAHLSDYLAWQVQLLSLDARQKKIAEEIIGNIDEDGYLRASAEEIATAAGCTQAEAEGVIQIVQDLDPPGIAARNLQEALVIQLEKKMRELENLNEAVPASLKLAAVVARDYLPLLEKRDLAGIIKKTSASPEEVKKAMLEIGRLQPRPGRAFQAEDTQTVTPDAVITFSDDEEGKLKIEIPDEQIPELRISPYYRRLLRSKDTDEKTRAFLKEKLQAAMNFLKALSLRKSTIRGITEEIVAAQPEFFEKGFSHLKPLRLKDIADALKIHESTVSRAIHGKYLATPQGMIPYKSFFSVKLNTTDGSSESQKSIMEKIRGLIGKEDPANPLSDQDLVKVLTQEGLVIARRTVAKYRELLKILPSHLRRKK